MIILVLSRFLIIYALFIHKVLSRYLDLVFFVVTAGGLYVFFFFHRSLSSFVLLIKVSRVLLDLIFSFFFHI
jgi:hypothetical protein